MKPAPHDDTVEGIRRIRRLRAIRAARVVRRTILPAISPPAIDSRDRFAQEVLQRLDGAILRHSMRLQLLHIARQSGIERFQACLIIAQVQHRVTVDRLVPAPASDARSGPAPRRAVFIPARSHGSTETPPMPPRLAWPRTIPYLAAAALQGVIIGGLWLMIH